MHPDTEILDLRGLKCPLPALMSRRALRRLGPGGRLSVTTDDPMAPIDIPHMCRNEGLEVVEIVRSGNTATMVLRNPG